MLRTFLWGSVIALAGGLVVVPPVQAQQQSVSLNVGYFAVRGEDARISDDVLLENLTLLSFDLGDFSNAAVGGEWLVGIGEYLEAGLGIGFYRRTVPSTYGDFVDADGSEIEQDLRLRVVPFAATVRLLPFGASQPVQPYVGGGLGVFTWRYSESGEFVDFSDFSIFRDRFVAEGTDAGPIAIGGLRLLVGSRYAVGGELRYQRVRGLVGVENGFLNDRIDLGGVTSQVTFQVKF